MKLSILNQEIPTAVGIKELDSAVEELADYLAVNCPDHYEAIVEFAKYRFIQGELAEINRTSGIAVLETLIERALPDLRSLSWHTDGRVIAKTGASAANPKKLYSAKTTHEALTKLISAKSTK